MDNNTCYACNIPLTKSNYTKEHLIPNSIGGRLKSSKLLCKTCNTAFGSGIDAELAKQLDSLCIFINISRERTKSNVIKNVKTETGKTYHLRDGKHPEITKPEITYSDGNINVKARNIKEVKQVIAGLKRKYPNLNDNNLIYTTSEYYVDETFLFNLSIGDDDFYRSVAKMAINTFLHNNGTKSNISDSIIAYINGGSGIDRIVHFYPAPPITVWDKSEISHHITIVGCSRRRALFAYVVLFNSYAFIVNINDDYRGTDVSINYNINTLTGKSTQKEVSINYPGRLEYIKYAGTNLDKANGEITRSVQENLSRVLGIAEQRQIKKTILEIGDHSYDEVMAKQPPNTEMTIKLFEEIIATANRKIEEYLKHINR